MFKQIKFSHLNIRSVFTNFDIFKEYIVSNDTDLFALSETWLNADINSDSIRISQYNLIRADRIGRGGGVGFFLKKSIKYNIIFSSVNDVLEQLWISIHSSGKRITFGVLYRPPSANLIQVFNALEDAMSFLLPSSDYIVFAGDLNINLLNIGTQSITHFNNFLEAFNLKQMIDEPTRITSTGQTLIDVLITSDSSIINSCNVTDSYGISDHCIISCNIGVFKINNKPKFITFRNFKHLNEESFYGDLNNINWNSIYSLADVDEMITFFNYNLTELFNFHAPLRTIRVTKKQAPWLTDVVKIMINLREKAFTKYKQTRSENDFNAYKNLRNYVTGAIRREKQAYLSHALKNKDSKTTWNTLRTLDIVNKKSCHELPDNLKNVDDINLHFNNIIPPVPSNNQLKLLDKYDNLSTYPKFSFSTVENGTVLKYIKSIKSNSVGFDQISLIMIKLISSVLLDHITFIINKSITSGIYPTMWKQSRIIPLPKKSNPTELSDIRPISILPTLSKVHELILKEQISTFVFDNNIIPPIQSGFRPLHSTTTALMHITDELFKATDQRKISCLVLLDYSKAFDTLDHNILCKKLQFYGFDAGSIALIKSYLSDRQQRVKLDDNVSYPLPVIYGVPQGSILGPLLFSIYISDFHTTLKSSTIHHYADDSQVMITSHVDNLALANDKLNKDLESLFDISSAHKLKLNSTKTELMVFGPTQLRNQAKALLNIKINDVRINISEYSKNLGLWLDENLRFTKHVNYLCQSSYIILKQLYSQRDIMSSNLKLQLCNSLIISKLSYCDTVYGPALLNVDSMRLQRIQNSCYRFSFGIRKFETGISEKIQQSGQLKLEKLRKLHLLSITHKVLKTKTPGYLHIKLQKLHNFSNSRETRHKHLLKIPRHATALFTRSFSYNACCEYNKLPSEFYHYTLVNFKKRLKTLLF